MSIYIDDDTKKNFRDIAEDLNHYATSKKCEYVSKIESSLQVYFESIDVSFWLYNKRTMQLLELCEEDNDALSIDDSLVETVIKNKKITIESHITSNKYYNPSIDNPHNLKVKSLILFPLFQNKELLGVVKVWRGMTQHKNFTKKDEASLEFFKPLFLYIFQSRSMSKETVLSFVGEEQKPIIQAKVEKKVDPSKNTEALKVGEEKYKKIQIELESYKVQLKQSTQECKALNKSIEKYTLQIEEDKKKIILTSKSHSEEVKALHTSIEAYKLQDISSRSEINGYQEQVKTSSELYQSMKIALNKSINKYESLEVSSVEIEQISKKSQETIQTLEQNLSLFKMENKTLQSEIKNLNLKSISPSIKDLKAQHVMKSQSKENILEKNIELLLQNFDTYFVNYECVSMFFELIVYTLSSQKGMGELEEIMKDSKLLEKLIYGYYFKGNLVLNNEKNSISDLVKYIKLYVENLPLVNVKIDFDENIPNTLIFDLPKLQSIIVHLVLDLYAFLDDSKLISLHFSFKNEVLQIEIGSTIEQKNSLMQSMFNQNKLDIEDKSRLGLQLSRKVIERLKGKINVRYENNYYTFILTFPAQDSNDKNLRVR